MSTSTDRPVAQPGDDPLQYEPADTAARMIGRLAEARRPANLNDPADVQMLYDNALTMLHMDVINFIKAAKSLGINVDPAKVLIARWAALAEKELHPSLVHRYTEAQTDAAAMTEGLRQIGRGGCESFTRGHCEKNGRTRDAQYGADRWCQPCVANAALDEPRGREEMRSYEQSPQSSRSR